MNLNPEISIVIPCLDEEKAISFCLTEILKSIEDNSLKAEVIVVDNGSKDNTVKIVSQYVDRYPNISLVKELKKGYGQAYFSGIKESKGKYIFIADSDYSYNFLEIPDFLSKIKNENADIVVGNRFNGKMEKGAMVWLHKYIGNPFFSMLGKFLFSLKIKDVYSGARLFRRDIFDKIKPKAKGMEFSLETLIKGQRLELKMVEISISYRKRMGESKLRTFKDGFSSLKFMILNFVNEY